MANNRRQLAEEFTQLVMDSIKVENRAALKAKKPKLITLSVRLPLRMKERLEKASSHGRVQQTQLVKHALVPLLAVLLNDEEPGSLQRSLLD